MKHPRRSMAAGISAITIALTVVVVRTADADDACFQCEDGLTTISGSNCWDLAEGQRHDQGSQVYFPMYHQSYAMNHENPTAYYCGTCDVHPTCAEPGPEGLEESEGGGALSLFDDEPTKLLAAVAKMDAEYFIEQSTGRLVVLNCAGQIAHQYKLTADQIAVLGANPEQVAASD